MAGPAALRQEDTEISDEPATRWSEKKYVMDAKTPRHVPWEIFTCAHGDAAKIFDLRALLNDFNRMGEEKNFDEFFNKRRGKSPEPVYDSAGKRLNTRERRFRDKKQRVINELLLLSNKYHKQVIHNVKTKFTKKVYFSPEFLDNHSFLVIIGPRGKTKKELEEETGAQLSLRGKGKQVGEFGSRGYLPGDEDDPHVLIQASKREDLTRAVDKVQWIMSTTPEAHMWRTAKLKELNIINGVFRDMPDAFFGDLDGGREGVFDKSNVNVENADDDYKQFMKELLDDEDLAVMAKEPPRVEVMSAAPTGRGGYAPLPHHHHRHGHANGHGQEDEQDEQDLFEGLDSVKFVENEPPAKRPRVDNKFESPSPAPFIRSNRPPPQPVHVPPPMPIGVAAQQAAAAAAAAGGVGGYGDMYGGMAGGGMGSPMAGYGMNGIGGYPMNYAYNPMMGFGMPMQGYGQGMQYPYPTMGYPQQYAQQPPQ